MTSDPDLDAVRRTYDTVAVSYADLFAARCPETALDLAMIGAFADRVRGAGPVVDAGCGPGRLTAHLADLGVDARGVDVSPEMVVQARQRHPGLRFEVGSMAALAVPDGALAGVLAWYSLIHTPPAQRGAVLTELHRVLAPGGHLLVGFHVGHERRVLTRAYGHDVECVAYALPVDGLVAELERAGLEVVARLVRAPEAGEARPQASLLARRPGGR